MYVFAVKQLWEMVKRIQVCKIVLAILFASIAGVIFQNKYR